jgi:hypothetical protein
VVSGWWLVAGGWWLVAGGWCGARIGARGAVGLRSCATGVARLDTSLSLIALAGALYLPFTPLFVYVL